MGMMIVEGGRAVLGINLEHPIVTNGMATCSSQITCYIYVNISFNPRPVTCRDVSVRSLRSVLHKEPIRSDELRVSDRTHSSATERLLETVVMNALEHDVAQMNVGGLSPFVRGSPSHLVLRYSFDGVRRPLCRRKCFRASPTTQLCRP